MYNRQTKRQQTFQYCTDIHTDKLKDRKTHRQTQRQTDTETDRQTDRQTKQIGILTDNAMQIHIYILVNTNKCTQK